VVEQAERKLVVVDELFHPSGGQDSMPSGVRHQMPTWSDVPESRRRIMRANRRRDTAPERAVRSLLHARGLRYRVDFPIRVAGSRPIRADIAFPRARIAVFIDGCFWHGCPDHGTMPVANAEYWGSKLAENKRRDARNTAALEGAGWRVVRAWTHEAPEAVADRVHAGLSTRDRLDPPTRAPVP
jgi:DNA mismatch endonuclease (patch repair protein)